MKKYTKLLAVLLAICLLCGLAACGKTTPVTAPETEQKAGTEKTEPEKTEPKAEPAQPGAEPAPEQPGTEPEQPAPKTERPAPIVPEPVSALTLHTASSYEEITKAIQSNNAARNYALDAGVNFTENAVEAEAPAAEPAEAPKSEEVKSAPAETGSSGDYSETNVQVKGVDEADIVKTDGKYIYHLTGNILRIFAADGAETELLSEKKLDTEQENGWMGYREMFLAGGKLYVIADKSFSTEKDGWYNWKDTVLVDIWDVSDPAAPAHVTDFGQDGYYSTSRLMNGVLYLISNHYSYWWGDEEAEPAQYIPAVYRNGAAELVPAGSIYFSDDIENCSYTVITAFDVTADEAKQTLSFADYTGTVYMSTNAIYLAATSYDTAESESYTEAQYTVTDYVNSNSTRLTKLTVSADGMTVAGSATVDGIPFNQFAMDELDGNLRIAVTTNRWSYRVFVDPAYDFSNSTNYESSSENYVLVLDGNLQLLGKTENLVSDESIYSVRFMGQTGYVVTYESIDPVFTINLTDPANPVVESALEVTGVSDYLHGYGDGLLFGFGRAIRNDAGFNVSDGLQLSMFDVTDAGKVSLLAKTVLDDGWSEALYNHKAILISVEKNLIAFPGESDNYYVFAYENGAFVKLGEFAVRPENQNEEDWWWSWSDSRGLYIGNDLYLVGTDALLVVDMTDFSVIRSISF